jgi:hypothetical protein
VGSPAATPLPQDRGLCCLVGPGSSASLLTAIVPFRGPILRQGVVRCDSLFGRADHKLAAAYPEGQMVIRALACLEK